MTHKETAEQAKIKNLKHLYEVGQRWVICLKEALPNKRDPDFIKREELRLRLIKQSIADAENKGSKDLRTFEIEYYQNLSEYMKDNSVTATVESSSLQGARRKLRRKLGRIYLKGMSYQKKRNLNPNCSKYTVSNLK
jgi:hypothetical protein